VAPSGVEGPAVTSAAPAQVRGQADGAQRDRRVVAPQRKGLEPSALRDAKFTGVFDAIVASEGLKIARSRRGPRWRSVTPTDGHAPHQPSAPTGCSSTANGTCSRCWLGQYAGHHNQHRPHQSRQQRPPGQDGQIGPSLGLPVQGRKVLGGVINCDDQAASGELIYDHQVRHHA
jgi:hypothetical protein